MVNARHTFAWIGCLCAALIVADAGGQPADAPAEGMVTLNFPDSVDLKVLIEYVGKRHGINFIYDEKIGSRKVTIKANKPVPADSLLTLLESALKMNGLTLSTTEVPNTMRVQMAQSLTAVSTVPKAQPQPPGQVRPTLVVTRVFNLSHASTARIELITKPFLSSTTANVTSLPDLDMVIVTDYADNMKRLEALVALVDREGRQVEVRFIPVANDEAANVSQKVTQILSGQTKAKGALPGTVQGGVTLLPDERTNQVAVIGPADSIDSAAALIRSLDVPLGLTTRIYSFTIASPDQVDSLVKKLIGDLTAKRLYQSATDNDSNLLIVTTTSDIHEQVESLREALDKPVEESQSPVRFYKLENANALDVLDTLRSIEGDAGLGDVSVDGVSANILRPNTVNEPYRGPTEADVNPAEAREQLSRALDRRPTEAAELPSARVMADESTNTIIVVAPPAVHPVYEKLIKRLDVRLAQVLVEATIVAIDTTNDFELGVEIYADSSVNGGDLLTFTQFGLSTPDSRPGSISLTPGIGFNGALLNADIAEIVIRALETDTRARVVSKPSVLINDNAEGTLVSEAEEPFTTTNASGVAGATTSFGGFAAAGTNIRITPQISEGDYLKLSYDITLSNFTSSGSDTLPPSRQTNNLISEATIPDGHTIVVGGLTRETVGETIQRVPLLGDIPIIEYLFSSRKKMTSKTTLFVFLRPVILRDDKFEDLKTLSDVAAAQAQLPGDYPSSEPIVIP